MPTGPIWQSTLCLLSGRGQAKGYGSQRGRVGFCVHAFLSRSHIFANVPTVWAISNLDVRYLTIASGSVHWIKASCLIPRMRRSEPRIHPGLVTIVQTIGPTSTMASHQDLTSDGIIICTHSPFFLHQE